MKKTVLHIVLAVLAAMLAVPTAAYAQERKEGGDDAWRERIESKKIAFLTSEMDLTPEEARVFWPVYNKAREEMREAMDKVMKTFGEMDRAVKDGKSEKEISALVHAYTAALAATKGVEEKNAKAYEQVISPVKVAKLLVGEEKFRMQQIRKLGSPDGKKGGKDAKEPKDAPAGKPSCEAPVCAAPCLLGHYIY